jgi:small neutral amino acid transporter SnatA (MarC family)
MAAVYWEEIMNLAILPLAITMLAGPQIMSAIIFVTSTRPVRTSAAFIIGVAIAATVGMLIAINVASLLDYNFSLGDSSDSGSTGHIVQYLLVGLLIAFAVKNYVRRETVEPRGGLGRSRGPTRSELSVSGSW